MPAGSALWPAACVSGDRESLDPHQRQEALQRLAHGETLVDVARTYAVDPTTIGRLLNNGA